ncbi:1559_t:CDS:1, partial [Funneliformis mosseae]
RLILAKQLVLMKMASVSNYRALGITFWHEPSIFSSHDSPIQRFGLGIDK